MTETQHFTLTDEHLALLRAAYIHWEDCEFGAPAIDCKRPYGNSDVLGDIHEILSGGGDFTEEQADRYRLLHAQTQTALQILIQHASVRPGDYEAERYSANWRFLGAEVATRD